MRAIRRRRRWMQDHRSIAVTATIEQVFEVARRNRRIVEGSSMREIIAAAFALFVTMSTASAQDIVGRWRDDSTGWTTEFLKSGSVVFTDGRQHLSGSWAITSPGILQYSASGQRQICRVSVNGSSMRLWDCPMLDSRSGRIIYDATATRID